MNGSASGRTLIRFGLLKKTNLLVHRTKSQFKNETGTLR